MKLRYEKPDVDVSFYEPCEDIITGSSESTNNDVDLNKDDEYNYQP